MKSVAVTLFLGVLCGAFAEHPIVKVINMLEGLKEKSIAEGKDEAVAFTKFQYWCSTSSDALNKAIAEEKEAIDELTDKLAGLNKQKKTLESEIETLEEEIANMDAAAKSAKEIRENEASLYSKANTDLKSTITAVQGCIDALSGAEGATEKLLLAQHHVKTMLSLVSLKVTEEQRQQLQDFAEKRPEQLAAGDEAAHVDKYDFKSENVIELLKQLKLSFEDEKLAGTKAETNAVNSYDVAKQARDTARKAADDSKKQKETTLGKTKSSITDTEGELKQQNSDLDEDTKTLGKTTDLCRMKTSEWEERSKTRTLEMEAMDQAVKILSKSAGVRTEAPSNPVPPPAPVTFLQLPGVSDGKMKAVVLLKAAAKAANSKALERLSVEVAAHLNGPFDAVNNMIEKMIFRLMDEQKQEDEHKHWCDQEIKKTNTMKSDKEAKLDDLDAEIEVEKAATQRLSEEIGDAETAINNIVTFVKEATEIRQTGKKENALALKDAMDAQKSLTNAIAVLTAFYKESGMVEKESWESMIQKAPVELPENPALWSDSYTGVSDPKKQETGIIAILETTLDDFEKMAAETKSQEAQDQKAFDEDMSAQDIDKAGRQQEVEMKTSEKARRVDKIASLTTQEKNVGSELEKTEQYLQDLKPACVDGDSSYGDRKDARAKEITALKTAQVTLEDAFKENAGSKFLQIRSHNMLA